MAQLPFVPWTIEEMEADTGELPHIIDLSEAELQWVHGIFKTAKKILQGLGPDDAKGSEFCPMYFMLTPDGFLYSPVGDFMQGDEGKNQLATLIRAAAREFRAIAVGLLSDSFQYSFDTKAVCAFGLDPTKHHDWPERFKSKYRKKREALILAAESQKTRVMIQQFYRRQPNLIFEEMSINAGASDEMIRAHTSGVGVRFVGILGTEE